MYGVGNTLSPLLVDKELPDKVLGEVGGLREELLVELVVDGDDVGVRLLLSVTEERRGTREEDVAIGANYRIVHEDRTWK